MALHTNEFHGLSIFAAFQAAPRKKMREEFKPAIEALQTDLADLEKQVLDTKLVINRLCVRAGMDPLYPDANAASSSTVSAVRADSFYGKSITTAAREFLDMRRNAGLGPATPREVFEALVKGGYTFEAKEDVTAIIGVRANLRKSSAIFHRLPNGTYGLLSWYPNARAARDGGDEDGNGHARKGGSKRRGAATKRGRRAKGPPPAAMSNPKAKGPSKADQIRKELLIFLAKGPRNRSDILQHMKDKGLMGYEQNPIGNLSAYLSRWKDVVTNDAEGNWTLAA